MEAWVMLREARGTAGEQRDRGSRNFVFLSNGVGLWGAFALHWAWPAAAIHARVLIPGVALIWLGMGLRIWAVRTLGKFFRTSVILQPDHRVITAGPYRRLRNPSYTGALISFVGIGLALDNWASLGLATGCMVLGYIRRISVEQRALTERFGQEYRDYIGRSWALVPFLW